MVSTHTPRQLQVEGPGARTHRCSIQQVRALRRARLRVVAAGSGPARRPQNPQEAAVE